LKKRGAAATLPSGIREHEGKKKRGGFLPRGGRGGKNGVSAVHRMTFSPCSREKARFEKGGRVCKREEFSPFYQK